MVRGGGDCCQTVAMGRATQAQATAKKECPPLPCMHGHVLLSSKHIPNGKKRARNKRDLNGIKFRDGTNKQDQIFGAWRPNSKIDRRTRSQARSQGGGIGTDTSKKELIPDLIREQ